MFKSQQLAQHLKQAIEKGVWLAHSRLPSLREQVQTTGYSLMTVLNAYQELEAQGLIYAKEKTGYFVAEQVVKKLDRQAASTSAIATIEINSLIFEYLKSIQRPDVVAFGSAFPTADLLTPTQLLRLISRMARHPRYYDQTTNLPPGNYDLRQVIAQRYCQQGVLTYADDIVITSGGLDALNLSLQALTQPGDYILLQQTTFYGAWQAAERLGLKVITLPEYASYEFDVIALEDLLRRYPIKVCWFMLNAQNPTGVTVSDDLKSRIAAILQKYEVHLIEDDVYDELYYGLTKPLAIKSFDQSGLFLHCSSFSKTLGASFRVGWVYAGKYSKQIQHLQFMSTISANSLIQNALAEFVASHHYEKHLRQLRRNLEKNKTQISHYLKMHLQPLCVVYSFLHGYFLWIKLPTHIDSIKLYQQVLSQKISIAPSPLFNLLTTEQQGIRINCSFEWSDHIQHALDILIQAILAYEVCE